MEDLFAAEHPILERLRVCIPTFRQVCGARNLEEIPVVTGTTPALYVLFDGHEPLVNAGPEQALEQRWLVVVAVRNSREADRGAGERREAGPLLWQVCHALVGWRPGPDHGPFRVTTTPGTLVTGGVALFPLRFATRVVVASGP
ncbi:MAG: hypothetical protein HQL98_12185 [Magnetococcales bacterium]|nr:hypothetical protein [Magnetococcales bacterium]